MPHPILYAKDHYVILRPGQGEEFLTAAEMLDLLRTIASANPDLIPWDPQQPQATQDQILQDLLDNSCELTWDNGDWIQWYAVRLEP
jgi:Protein CHLORORESPIRATORY REDUCTION 7